MYIIFEIDFRLADMFSSIKRFFFSIFKFRMEETIPSLREWRSRLLDGVLSVIFVLWMIALVSGLNNVFTDYKLHKEIFDNPFFIAVITASFYLVTTVLLILITFNRRVRYGLRAAILLFILYILGMVGMLLTSFSGDGRIFFFAFIILSVVFFELRASLAAFFITFLTFIAIGYLQVSGIMTVPPELQVNASRSGAWFSGGMVFLILSIAAATSISFLLQAFERSLIKTQEALAREKRLGEILRTISDINQLIVRIQDPERLLKAVCEQLVWRYGLSFAWVGLLERNDARLKLAASAGEREDLEDFNNRFNTEGEPVCALQAIHDRSAFFINFATGEDPCASCPRRSKYPDRSAMALPLLRGKRTFGVLVVDRDKEFASFTVEEINLLRELADNLAYALEHIEAAKQLSIYAGYQTLLNEVTQTALEAFDLDTLLHVFIGKLERTLNADIYYFALWDNERQMPGKFVFSENLREVFSDLTHIDPEDNIFSRSILNERRVLAISDVTDSPFMDPKIAGHFGVASAMGLPLFTEDQQLGVLVLGYKEKHEFTSEELLLGEQASRQLALAILKVRLDDEMRLKAIELEQLFSAARDMASNLFNPPALLAKLAQHMADALNVTSTNITSFNLATNSMQVVAEYWSEEAAPGEVQSDLGKEFSNKDYATIINSMMDGRVKIMHADDPEMTQPERAQFTDYQIKTMMFIPILSHGRLLGTIELWESRRRREYSQSEIQLAQAMTSYAANVIENSTLFAETRQRESEMETMLMVAQTVSSSLELDDVIQQAAVSLSNTLEVDDCYLSEYQPDSRTITTVARYVRGGMKESPDDKGFIYQLDDYPISEQVMLSGKPIIIHVSDENADRAEVAYLKKYGYAVSLILPLRVHNVPLGMVELSSYDPGRNFTKAEINLAHAIADQVAVAIENARLYNQLEQREAHYRALIDNSAEGVAILNTEGMIQFMAPSEEQLTGYRVDELMGQSAFQYVHEEDLPQLLAVFHEGAATPGAIRTAQYRLQRKDGEWRYFEVTGQNMLDDPHIGGIVVNYRDVTERKLAEQAIRESEERYRTIFQSAGIPIWEDDYSELMDVIDEIKQQGVTDFKRYLEEHPEFIRSAAQMIKVIDANDAVFEMMGAANKEELLGSLNDVVGESPVESFSQDLIALAEGKRHLEHESYLYTLNGERRDVWISVSFPDWSEGNSRVLVTTLDITSRKQVEREFRDNKLRLEAIIDTALNAIITIDEEQRVVLFNPFAEKIFGCTAEFAMGKSLEIFLPQRFRGNHHKNVETFGTTNTTNRVHGRMNSLYGLRANGEEFPMEAYVSQQKIGDQKFYTVILRDITDRIRAEEDQRRRSEELQTLAFVSSALRTALSVSEIIPLAVRYAVEIVAGDYGTIYMLEEPTGNLVSPGWYSVKEGKDIKVAGVPLLRHTFGVGITGHVAKTGELYITEDLQKDPLAAILPDEKETLSKAHSGISLPLLSREMVVGVLHIRLTKEHFFTETEIRLLTAIAEMAGSALHRANLYEQTLQQADELTRAYDSTLSGWARALEMRDELTEGHTRRVTELTLQLARVMHIPESEIVQIRRGATLHDIGKMGIPDSILNKPGPLSAHEQRIMRMHPQYAFEMLSFIPFLQPALEIPYCHHEWWDGNGYPRGLKGEEIPLSARIFSVVDVWDALTSDRPYRAAWTKERTLNYIQDGTGKQFDPRVVKAFLMLIAKQ